MAPWKDITGHRFGYLTAVERTQRELSSGRRMPAWRLRCDCGNEVVAMTVNLTKGNHRSCGCKQAELTCEARGYRGDTKLPEYRIYRQMLDRCYLASAPNFEWYGAKGVTVCDRWRFGADGLTGFQCFIRDMGRRPGGMTLDRRRPTESYSPDNCRWATWEEQAKNKRVDHFSPAKRQEYYHALARKRARLTRAAIDDIRHRLLAGQRQVEIAAVHGISQAHVSSIKLDKIGAYREVRS